MDILTHIFLPLIALYSVGEFKKKYLLLSVFAILPDFDVFLGVHRGLFHSLIFLLPLAVLLMLLEYGLLSKIKYSLVAIFFLSSHLFLDALAGGVPFFYPVIDTGVGIEFPFVIEFGSSIIITEFLPKLVYITPELVHGKSFNAFSSFGIAAMILFGFMYYWNWRSRDE
ncbi:MAG: metal-dependent hydrolase [Halobacteriota archaeon]